MKPFRYFFYTQSEKAFAASLKLLLGFYPKNLKLYHLAFTHSSVAEIIRDDFKESNERLEFLGDTILDSVISHYLYVKYPFKDEGFLTRIRSRIVSRYNLNPLAVKLGLDNYLQTSDRGIQGKSIYGNALEAFIGAIYLDAGYKKTQDFVIKNIVLHHLDIDEMENTDNDFKSKLITYVQQQKIPFEFILGKTENQYKAILKLNDKTEAEGLGFSKKQAEQEAARLFFEKADMDN